MRRGLTTSLLYFCATIETRTYAFVQAKHSPRSYFTRRTMSSEAAVAGEEQHSWRSLLEASMGKTRKIRGSNYVQLATVEEGEPRCRTIVFRGFLNLPEDHRLSNICEEKMCIMKMCTHLRSKKVAQNAQQPIAEIVWWFPKTSEQYRIRGPLILVGDDAAGDRALEIARKELWGNISGPARESFLSQVVPGESLEKDTSDVPEGGRDEEGKVMPPPANFLLMLLDPTNVDYLRLTSDQHRQVDLRSGSDWTSKRVNP
jgi:pyridoxamine 5'-phosphate oxidase